MDVVYPDVSPGAVRKEPLHHHLPRSRGEEIGRKLAVRKKRRQGEGDGQGGWRRIQNRDKREEEEG